MEEFCIEGEIVARGITKVSSHEESRKFLNLESHVKEKLKKSLSQVGKSKRLRLEELAI